MIKTGLWGMYRGIRVISYRAGNGCIVPAVSRGFGGGGGCFCTKTTDLGVFF